MDGELEPSKLTDKEKLFVKAYVGEARLNASRAARIAGYKDPEQSGWINKRKVEIRAAIDAELEKMASGRMKSSRVWLGKPGARVLLRIF